MICLKPPKSSEFAKTKNKQRSKILNCVYYIMCLPTIQMIFKYREIKKKRFLKRIRTRNPWVLRLRKLSKTLPKIHDTTNGNVMNKNIIIEVKIKYSNTHSILIYRTHIQHILLGIK